MEAKDTDFTRFISTEEQFYVPIYQRKYSWDKNNCLKLLADIIAVGRDLGRPCHFIGSVIYLSRRDAMHASAIREYLVIDGQQRLMTLSIILLALADYTRQRIKDNAEYKASTTNLERISSTYVYNIYEHGDLRYKDRLNDEDFRDWKKLLEDRTRPDGFNHSRIFNNYESIFRELVRLDVAPQLVFNGIKKLKLVDICLAPEDNAQLVFETVNSTGLSLSISDKIRNFLLMQLSEERQRKLYEDYWHPMEISFGMESGNTKKFFDFFKYYMTLEKKQFVRSDFYDIFKTFYFENKAGRAEELVKELCQYSKYYHIWMSATLSGDRIQKALFRVRSTGQLKITPFILRLLSERKEGIISEDDALEILNIMDAYWMRRQVCFIPSNTAGSVCTTLLRSLDGEDKLRSFKEAIFNLTWLQRMPDDNEIRETLKTLKIYARNNARTKQILDRLENNQRKEYVPTSEYTIEHIMPQTLSDEWRSDLGEDAERIYDTYLHTIGNLTLAGYNSEYQNKRFVEKKECLDDDGKPIGYNHTPIKISWPLKDLDHWGEAEILARSEDLANQIIAMWKYPEREK